MSNQTLALVFVLLLAGCSNSPQKAAPQVNWQARVDSLLAADSLAAAQILLKSPSTILSAPIRTSLTQKLTNLMSADSAATLAKTQPKLYKQMFIEPDLASSTLKDFKTDLGALAVKHKLEVKQLSQRRMFNRAGRRGISTQVALSGYWQNGLLFCQEVLGAYPLAELESFSMYHEQDQLFRLEFSFKRTWMQTETKEQLGADVLTAARLAVRPTPLPFIFEIVNELGKNTQGGFWPKQLDYNELLSIKALVMPDSLIKLTPLVNSFKAMPQVAHVGLDIPKITANTPANEALNISINIEELTKVAQRPANLRQALEILNIYPRPVNTPSLVNGWPVVSAPIQSKGRKYSRMGLQKLMYQELDATAVTTNKDGTKNVLIYYQGKSHLLAEGDIVGQYTVVNILPNKVSMARQGYLLDLLIRVKQ